MNVTKAATEGDVETVKQWLAEPHTRHPKQVAQVQVSAASNGHNNICHLMLDSGQVSNKAISIALKAACTYNKQSRAQLLVERSHTTHTT
jgi:hypothetical protein